MTHAKIVVVDGKKSFVGSFNFSEAAFMKNRESGVVIESEEVAESLIRDFREIPHFSPGPVAGAAPIPSEFMSRKDLCRQMIKCSDNYVMDLYLLCQKISWETKDANTPDYERIAQSKLSVLRIDFYRHHSDDFETRKNALLYNDWEAFWIHSKEIHQKMGFE